MQASTAAMSSPGRWHDTVSGLLSTAELDLSTPSGLPRPVSPPRSGLASGHGTYSLGGFDYKPDPANMPNGAGPWNSSSASGHGNATSRGHSAGRGPPYEHGGTTGGPRAHNGFEPRPSSSHAVYEQPPHGSLASSAYLGNSYSSQRSPHDVHRERGYGGHHRPWGGPHPDAGRVFTPDARQYAPTFHDQRPRYNQHRSAAPPPPPVVDMGMRSHASTHAPVEKLDAEQAEELARLAKNVEQNGNKVRCCVCHRGSLHSLCSLAVPRASQLDRMQVSVDSVVANADHVARTVKQVRGVAARIRVQYAEADNRTVDTSHTLRSWMLWSESQKPGGESLSTRQRRRGRRRKKRPPHFKGSNSR